VLICVKCVKNVPVNAYNDLICKKTFKILNGLVNYVNYHEVTVYEVSESNYEKKSSWMFIN